MEREKLLFVNEAAAVGASWEQQLNNGFLNPSNWDNSMDQSDPFESALSSIVSSPVAQQPSTNATPIPPHGDTFMIRELIGRLGSICNSGGVGVVVDDSISLSPQSYLRQHQTQHHHHNHHNNNNTTTSSTNNSCYTTPISSPPKHNLSMVDPHNMRALAAAATHHNLAPLAAADPGFAERAARLSCFGTRSTLHLNTTTTMNRSSSSSCLETNKLYRLAAGSQMKQQQETNNIQDGDSKESSSVSEPQTQSQNDASSSRKRKSVPRTKAKDTTTTTTTKTPSSTNDAKVVTENEESNRTKRSKQEEAESNGNENDSGKAKSGGVDGNQKQNNNNNNKDNSKPPEPPKDYIHVRARRGQATDSHSLAERVRREKISERMKFLQDLVPGCNKVTGKAVMLDEIINYVQSLQRQVEFLSMKLATVNPRMDFNVEALLSKDMFQSRGALQNAVYQVDSSASTFPFGYQPQAGLQPLNGGSIPNNADTQFSINNSSSNNHPLDSAAAAALHRNPNLQLPSSNGYGETPAQAPSFWEDDLQSLVQMGFNQNQPQSFHGSSVTTAQMKIEL